jgi:hypothetical protein
MTVMDLALSLVSRAALRLLAAECWLMMRMKMTMILLSMTILRMAGRLRGGMLMRDYLRTIRW